MSASSEAAAAEEKVCRRPNGAPAPGMRSERGRRRVAFPVGGGGELLGDGKKDPCRSSAAAAATAVAACLSVSMV